MTTRIWLIRHGEPTAEIQGRCYGALDVGLSPHGERQMERVGHHLAREPLAAIYASPRRRASESARILAAFHSCGYKENAGLRELNFGDFEGMTYDDIAAQYPELYRRWMDAPTEVQFPNGESFTEMRVRVLEAFETILHTQEGKTIAVVSHGGAIRILIAWALQMPDRCLFRISQDHASMNLLIWIDGLPTVQSMNVTAI